MSLADLKKNFIQQVKLRAYDDQYVDKAEELEILKAALDAGINLDSARGVLMQVCETENYVLESRILSEVKDLIDTFAGNDGKIDEKEFTDAVTVAKKRTNGKKSERIRLQGHVNLELPGRPTRRTSLPIWAMLMVIGAVRQ